MRDTFDDPEKISSKQYDIIWRYLQGYSEMNWEELKELDKWTAGLVVESLLLSNGQRRPSSMILNQLKHLGIYKG